MSKTDCRECSNSLVGSHLWAIDVSRCDNCYKKWRRGSGDTAFCRNCLYGYSGNEAKSLALNNGLCEGCFSGKNSEDQIARTIEAVKRVKGGFSTSSSSNSGGCMIVFMILSGTIITILLSL